MYSIYVSRTYHICVTCNTTPIYPIYAWRVRITYVVVYHMYVSQQCITSTCRIYATHLCYLSHLCNTRMGRIYVSHLCVAYVHHTYLSNLCIASTCRVGSHQCITCTHHINITSVYRIYVSHLCIASMRGMYVSHHMSLCITFMYHVYVSHLCITSVDRTPVSHLCTAYMYHIDTYISLLGCFAGVIMLAQAV